MLLDLSCYLDFIIQADLQTHMSPMQQPPPLPGRGKCVYFVMSLDSQSFFACMMTSTMYLVIFLPPSDSGGFHSKHTESLETSEIRSGPCGREGGSGAPKFNFLTKSLNIVLQIDYNSLLGGKNIAFLYILKK